MSPVPRRLALLVATDSYEDPGLSRLVSPAADVEALASVLADPDVAGFEVTTLVNEPHHQVGAAVGDLLRDRRRDDLTLLYFTGHGLKDDAGRLYLATTDTRRDNLLFTALAAEQIDAALSACLSRRQLLILDCCYSGAFPAGRGVKADTEVHTLERFRGRGRTVLTATDSTQYAFEGDQLRGGAATSVFTRHLVVGLRDGSADLDRDGDITVDELYTYVHERVTEEMPQQHPKRQDDVEGRLVVARNVRWTLPAYLADGIASPLAAHRLSVLDGLDHLHRIGNPAVREAVETQFERLAGDDSRMVSSAAARRLAALNPPAPELPAEVPPAEVPPAPEPAAEAPPAPVPPAEALPVVEAPAAVEVAKFDAAPAVLAPTDVPAEVPRSGVPWWRDWRGIVAVLVVLAIGIPVGILLNRDDGGSAADAGSAAASGTAFVRKAAVSPDGATLYVTTYKSVAVIDTARATLTASIPVSGGADDVAVGPDGTRLYVSSGTDVSVFDTTTRLRVGGVSTNAEPQPVSLALAPVGHRLYVSLPSHEAVDIVDTATNTVIGQITIGGTPRAMAVSPDGTRLYVGDVDTVSTVDTAGQKVVARAALAGAAAIVPNKDGRLLYVGGGDRGLSTLAAGATRGAVTVSSLRADALAISRSGRLWLTSYATDRLLAFDTATNKIMGTPITVSGPGGVVLSPDGKRVYVPGFDAAQVSVFDAATGKIVGSPTNTT